MERLSMGGATSDRLGEAEGRASHGAALSGTYTRSVSNVKITHTLNLAHMPLHKQTAKT